MRVTPRPVNVKANQVSEGFIIKQAVNTKQEGHLALPVFCLKTTRRKYSHVTQAFDRLQFSCLKYSFLILLNQQNFPAYLLVILLI